MISSSCGVRVGALLSHGSESPTSRPSVTNKLVLRAPLSRGKCSLLSLDVAAAEVPPTAWESGRHGLEAREPGLPLCPRGSPRRAPGPGRDDRPVEARPPGPRRRPARPRWREPRRCSSGSAAPTGTTPATRSPPRRPREMLRLVLGDAAGVTLLEVPDLDDGPRWRAMVVELLRAPRRLRHRQPLRGPPPRRRLPRPAPGRPGAPRRSGCRSTAPGCAGRWPGATAGARWFPPRWRTTSRSTASTAASAASSGSKPWRSTRRRLVR